jgi:Ethylene insensitive 3
MDRNKRIILPGESSNSQTNLPASSSEVVPGQSSNNQINGPASGSEVVLVQSSNIQTNPPASISEVAPGQSSSSKINAPASISKVVPGQSSNIQTGEPASNSEVDPGQSSHSEVSVLIVPGQSSNIQTSEPASNSEVVPWQISNIQTNTAASSSEVFPSSDIQTDAPAFNPVAIPSIVGRSGTLQPDEDTSEPTNTHPDNDNSDHSSDESTTSEEPEEVQEWRRKFAFYTDLFDKTAKQQGIERADVTRKRKAEGPPSDMSPEEKINFHHTVLQRYFKEATEYANMQGYAYGIVLLDNRVLTGCSESLRKWWYETIKFEQAGPIAADQYYSANQAKLGVANIDEPPERTYDLLMKLCDATMGAVLSALMSKCNPPQRKFPFQNKAPPPWWPTGSESWWEETGEERPEPGQPQYKKPHDIKKKWKAIIVLSVIKHMAPNFELIVKTVKSSKNLQDRLSVREMEAWNFALKQEMKIYCQGHPNVALSDLMKAFQSHNVLVPGQRGSSSGNDGTGIMQQQPLPPLQQQMQYQQQHQVRSMANQPGDNRMFQNPRMEMFPDQQRMLRFTCQNQGCLYHNNEWGFRTTEARDKHQQSCNFQIPISQVAAPGELHPMVPPFSSTSEGTVPPFGSTYQGNVPPFSSTSQGTVSPFSSTTQGTSPSFGSTSQGTALPFGNPSEGTVVPFGRTSQGTVLPFGSTSQGTVPPFGDTSQGTFQPFGSPSQGTVPPMHPAQQMVQPPSQSMLAPVDTSILQMFGQNSNMIPPEQGCEPFDSVLDHQSAPTGNLDMGQWHPGLSFSGFYNGPGGTSSAGGEVNDGSYMQMLNDTQLHGADPSLYQYLLENFQYRYDDAMQMSNDIQPIPMPPQQQFHGADPSMQQNVIENFHYGGGEGSSTGVPQQTGFQPFENPEMQIFLDGSDVEMRTNFQLPEGTQFGQRGPLDGSFSLSQPSLAPPGINITQASDMQQSAPHEVQNTTQQSAPEEVQDPTPSRNLDQFGTGNNEFWQG